LFQVNNTTIKLVYSELCTTSFKDSYQEKKIIPAFEIVIHLFGDFEIISRKMICLDVEIKRNLKLRNFKKI